MPPRGRRRPYGPLLGDSSPTPPRRSTALMTVVSVRFLGWAALIVGIAELLSALFRLRAGHFWSTALGGALLAVLGVLILRNTLAAALTLTLAAGALFLAV